MCLQSISKEPLEKTEGIGWKIFRQFQKSGRVTGLTFCPNTFYSRRTWYVRSLDFVRDPTPKKLANAGFHVYVNREDAVTCLSYIQNKLEISNAVVRKVRYRKAFSHGSGDGFNQPRIPVVVAEEIYIIEANRA